MDTLVKSKVDGRWYYVRTQWKYVFDCISDALDCFSESDFKLHPLSHQLNSIADEVHSFIKNDKSK